MIPVGNYSTLQVKALRREGLLLTDGRDEVLLPARLAPEGVKPGQSLQVFVYTDSQDELIATTEKPYAAVGEFALLEVVDITGQGAFLDWGLGKDLFVPKNQQYQPMRLGYSYVVALFVDERTQRVAAASKLGPYFDYDLSPLKVEQEVDLLAYGYSDLGTQVVVEGRYAGLVYASETFRSIEIGDELKGYVRALRNDNRVDISLQRSGRRAADDALGILQRALEERGGVLLLTDRSSPEEIYAALGISKKAFKAAVGKLYKARKIVLEPHQIRLVEGD